MQNLTLTCNEINLKHYLKERLVLLLREEEIKWYERVKAWNLLQGDDNTCFFHLVANGKYCKQHIFRLEKEGGVIASDTKLRRYIIKYYNNLFGQPEDDHISLVESWLNDIPQVSATENEILTSSFTKVEVKEAVFHMKRNKTSGWDGFPAEIYQVFFRKL